MEETTQVDAPEGAEVEETKEPEEVKDSPEAKEETEVSDAEKAEKEPPKKKSRSDRKIEQLAYQNREQKRQIDKLIKLTEQNLAKQTTSDIKPPNPDDFDTLAAFVRAEVKYDKQVEDAKKAETKTKEPEKGEPPEGIEDFISAGEEKHEDFLEVVMNANFTDSIGQALIEIDDDDVRTETAYFLASNQKEVRRISRLSPLRQAAEVGKLEAKIASKPPPKKASKAPKPIKPVGNGDTNTTEITGKESMEDFIDKRNRQLGRY